MADFIYELPTHTLLHLLSNHANWIVLKPTGRHPLNYFASIRAPMWVISGTHSLAFAVSIANNALAYTMEQVFLLCYFCNFNQMIFLFFEGEF